jgi:hypothetical protein
MRQPPGAHSRGRKAQRKRHGRPGAAVARLAATRGYDLCLIYRSETAPAKATAEACRTADATVLLERADMAGGPRSPASSPRSTPASAGSTRW